MSSLDKRLKLRSLMPRYWDALRGALQDINIEGMLKGAPTVSAASWRVPELAVRIDRKRGDTAHGKGGPKSGVKLSLGENVGEAEVQELLLHEMCHALLGPMTANGKAQWHNATFSKVLMAAAKKLWGIEVAYVIGSGRCYILDELLVVELRKKYRLPPGPTPFLDELRARRAKKRSKLAQIAAGPALTAHA